jgi:hypothetical protein
MTKTNGHQDPRIASLDEARKKAAQKAKADQELSRPGGARTGRDWLIGGLFIAMAIGMIVFWVMGFGNSTNVVQQ